MRLRTSVRAETRPEVQHALFLAWQAANRICAKRLIPFLPTLLEALERHAENTSLPAGNAGGAMPSGSDRWIITLASFRKRSTILIAVH
jgi:hypothetical protein